MNKELFVSSTPHETKVGLVEDDLLADVGLERDAFLYVSDFMELEEHDEDLTDSVPANRGVQDLRTPAPGEPAPRAASEAAEPEASFGNDGSQDFVEAEEPAEEGQAATAAAPDASAGGTSQ